MDANAFDEQRHISAMVTWTTNPDLSRESESFPAGVVVEAENRRDHVGVVDGWQPPPRRRVSAPDARDNVQL